MNSSNDYSDLFSDTWQKHNYMIIKREGRRDTKMEVYHRDHPFKQVVYVQMRQAVRDKDGRLKVTRTKTKTIRNATIEQVWAIFEKGGNGKAQKS